MWVWGCNAFVDGNISSLKGRSRGGRGWWNCGPATDEISRTGLRALAHVPENLTQLFECPSSPLPGEPAHRTPLTFFAVLVA